MTDECDEVRGMERWVCKIKQCVSVVNNVFGLNVFVRNDAENPANSTILSGENHIGEVGTNTKILRMNPTIQTSLYTSGKVIGGLITLNGATRKNGGTGLISNLVARIASSTVYPALEITLFSENPTSSTFGDNQVFALADADIGKAVAVFNINKSDYILTGGKYRAKSSDSYQGVESKSDSQNIYAVIVAKEDVTFPSDHALFIKMDNLRD
ncbi:hypothetical protein [Methanobacterium sp.]|uniref:hypothetical protein n=1 Tax=Methanobacterium sp. TaxID=2164 RepID=UPI0031597798